MRFVLILVTALFLASCDNASSNYYNQMKPLTNEEVIKELKYCEDNHLSAIQMENFASQIVYIQCYSKE